MGIPSKKRKTILRWTEQVREQTGLEGPVDDGYSWRKYGMNYAFGARHLRSYYRCTNKSQGCSALKQVQRSEEDPSMFIVTYRRRHNCIQSAHLLPEQSEKRHDQQDEKQQKGSVETLINFQTGCHVKTEESHEEKVVLKSPSFSFPSAPLPTKGIEKQSTNNIFSSQLTPDNQFMSSPFSSSSTSESNSLSSHKLNNYGGGQNLQTSD
ncbi:hypothetical protein MKW98_005032 [Papaver atlanticum]|uniref:WRKY domain-containing protein n=1 Tax=Papaver atlanticum TaxID=357466 RepID=A0AAD4TDB1_9MAGN|nr:hypothetical protein MKW98_005032 [Papaver atlanticum]